MTIPRIIFQLCSLNKEENVINEAIVMQGVGLDVNHMLSFQAGIIILLMFAERLLGRKRV